MKTSVALTKFSFSSAATSTVSFITFIKLLAPSRNELSSSGMTLKGGSLSSFETCFLILAGFALG